MGSGLLGDLSHEIRAPRSLLLRGAGKMLVATDCPAIRALQGLYTFLLNKGHSLNGFAIPLGAVRTHSHLYILIKLIYLLFIIEAHETKLNNRWHYTRWLRSSAKIV